MSWCKLEVGFHRHPKTLLLADMLHVSRREAKGLITDLWEWALESRKGGDLGGISDRGLALALEATKNEISALAQCGWLDGEENSRRVHGWEDRQASWNAAERQRKSRQKKASRDGHVTVTQCHTTPSHSGHENVTGERRGKEKRRDLISSQSRRDLVISPAQDDAQIAIFQTEGKPQDPVSLSVTQVIDLWNTTTSGFFPYARPGVTTSTRRRHIAARLAQPDRDAAWWEALFRRMMASDFLRGLTKAGFKATLSFAVASEARIDDILEGKYDNLRASPTEAPMKEFRLPWEDQG